MKNIDFLPQRYRDNNVRRKAGVWRFVVVLCLGGTVAAASLGQFAYRGRVKRQVTEIQPLLAQAKASESELAQLRNELTRVSHTATLYAVVQTPWPRTQILAAIVEPLEEGITIVELHHSRRPRGTTATTSPASEFQLGPSEKKKETLSAVEQDLAHVREQLRNLQDMVHIHGETDDSTRLHAYLARLEAAPILERVELLEVDSVKTAGEPTRVRFTASVIVRQVLLRNETHASDRQPDNETLGRLAG